MFIIAHCPSCGKIIMANTSYRTRICPHCGFRISLVGLRVLARAKTSQEAINLIQALKERQIDEVWEPNFKHFKP